MREEAPGPSPHVRVIQLPRAVALLLVVPVLLALGVATMVALVVAVGAMILAPFLVRRPRAAATSDLSPEHETITLERDAYRTTGSDADGTPRRDTAATRGALPPPRSPQS